MVIENKVKTLTITTFLSHQSPPCHCSFQNIMSSSPHSTITSSAFDMENAFSTMNIHNYTSTSSPTMGSTSFNSSKDSRDGSPISPPDPITPPVILTPSPVLPPSLQFDPQYLFVPEKLLLPKKQIYSPSSSTTTLSNSRKQAYSLESQSFSVYTPTLPQIFEIGKSSIKEHLKHHEKQIKDILYYLEELSFHLIEKMEERLVNGWIIIPRDFDKMPPKRTSTSEASAMTLAAIRKLVANRVAIALEAQAATMARAVGLIRWFKWTELVCSRSNCGEKNKVKFAINTLTGEALFWWNSFAQPIGLKEAYKITLASAAIFIKMGLLQNGIRAMVIENKMLPKRTLTSAAPAMTQAAIRQLITDDIVAALEAQAAAMENADNPNRNTTPR
ncbi:hypothetical protein Tco_0733867 [Tanacetum coccineum]